MSRFVAPDAILAAALSLTTQPSCAGSVHDAGLELIATRDELSMEWRPDPR